MSMYGNGEKDIVYSYIAEFLKNHTVSELLTIVTDAVEYEKEDIEEDNNICPYCGYDRREENG